MTLPVESPRAHVHPLTGEPRRPWTIRLATITNWVAVAAVASSLLGAYWIAIQDFAAAAWLTGLFPTEPGSTERVLLVIAVTLIVVVIAVGNVITGFYAWMGYRWSRISGLIAATLSFAALTLTQIAWVAIPLSVVGAALLWLPASSGFFLRWQALRHPEIDWATPPEAVEYGPLSRYR